MASRVIKIEFEDGTVQVIDPAPAVSPPPPPPPLPVPSPLTLGGYFDGIPDIQGGTFAAEFGMKWVRIWHTVNWSERIGPSHPTLMRAAALQAQGLKVLAVCTPPEKTGAPPTDPSIAASYFSAMASAASGSIDAWEIFNEPNLANYNTSYAGSSTLWIKNALMPAYSVLHPLNQFVVSGGWSGNPGDANGAIAWMVKNGLLTYCDAVGHHPYGATAAEQLGYVQQMRKLIGTKPLWITEWNLHANVSDPAGWMNELQNAAIAIQPIVNAVFHFRMTYNTSQAGVAAPFDATLAVRAPWYLGTQKAMESLA